MPSNKDDTLERLRQLLELFRMERLVYIGVTLIALFVLIGCAIYMIFVRRTEDSIAIGVGLFGSSGAITFSISRLLTMYNQAFKVVFGSDGGKDNGE